MCEIINIYSYLKDYLDNYENEKSFRICLDSVEDNGYTCLRGANDNYFIFSNTVRKHGDENIYKGVLLKYYFDDWVHQEVFSFRKESNISIFIGYDNIQHKYTVSSHYYDYFNRNDPRYNDSSSSECDTSSENDTSSEDNENNNFTISKVNDKSICIKNNYYCSDYECIEDVNKFEKYITGNFRYGVSDRFEEYYDSYEELLDKINFNLIKHIMNIKGLDNIIDFFYPKKGLNTKNAYKI